jgi:hypothetical protein
VVIEEEATPMAMATVHPATSTVPFTGQPRTTLRTVVPSSKTVSKKNISKLITNADVRLDKVVDK